MKYSAKLVAITQPTIDTNVPSAEALVAYCARVSNPSNQDKHDTAEKLLKYCIENKHWSVFEMVNAVVEVTAPRDITRQLLRHRSFSFQEFSQRYAEAAEFSTREFRAQDKSNRQNSLDSYNRDQKFDFIESQFSLLQDIYDSYKEWLDAGVAKECARVILPEGLTMSRLYVNGTLRSWLHYLDVRDDPGVTQHEHVLLAREIRQVLLPAFPTIFKLKGDSDVSRD
jgi:thymidylate synthase (FAD)